MNGNNIIILKDGTPIGAVKSNEITTKAGTIETASPVTGAWKTYIAGRKDWSVSVGYLVLSAARLADLLTVGGSYTLVIRDRANSTSVTGSAILTTCKITATRGNLVQGSFSFQGNGALT